MLRTGLATAGALLAVALGWLLFAPQQLGGPVAVVSTFGDSMLPTYRPHDLVVVRRDRDYDVGDVVAYRSPLLDTVVLHRIVEIDDGELVTSGDNNDWLDPDRPGFEDVIGRASLRIPQLGRLLELPRLLRVLLAVAVAGLVVAAGRARRGNAGSRLRDRVSTRQSGTGPVDWSGVPVQLLAVGGVALVVGSGLAVAAWTRPATAPGPVVVEQQGTFSYGATVPPGLVYPDGRIDPPEPVFLQLADRLEVSFDWALEDDRVDHVRGNGRLVAVVANGTGWQHPLPVGPPTEWEGPTASLAGELDLSRARALADEFAETTGVAGDTLTVTLTADIDVEAELDGTALGSHSTPSLDFQVDQFRATPAMPTADPTGPDDAGADDAGPDVVDPNGAGPLTVVEVTTVTVPDAVPTHLDVAGRTLAVTTARDLSSLLIVFALLAGAAGTALALRTRDWNQHRRIDARYGRGIVDVATLPPDGGRTAVTVTSFEHLARLAEYRQVPILRITDPTDGPGYLVDDTSHRYTFP